MRVEHQAREGQGNTILGHLSARCLPGYVFQELTVEVSQGGFTAPGQQLPAITCDGFGHRIAFTSFEGFDPGRASIAARFTEIDDQFGDPAPQGLDSQDTWVRPAARNSLPARGSVSHGRVALVLHARCDRPWVEPDLSVSVSQGAVGASASVVKGSMRCDGAWHRLVVVAAAGTGSFHRGRVDVLAHLTVDDPDSFDPVAQAQSARSVRVR